MKTLESPAFRAGCVAALFAVTVLAGCRSPMEPPAGHGDNPAPGADAVKSVLFSPVWAGETRTIMPIIPTEGLTYELLLVGEDREVGPIPLVPGEPVTLQVGTWLAIVTVFADGLPFAQGQENVVVTADGPNVQKVTIELRPSQITGHGNPEGTFKWRIHWKNDAEKVELKSGTVRLTDLGDGSVREVPWGKPGGDKWTVVDKTDGDDPLSQIRLPPGQYHANFILTDYRDDTFNLSEVLHVYPNLASRAEYEIERLSFPRYLLDLILDNATDDGTAWKLEENNILPVHLDRILGIKVGTESIGDLGTAFGVLTEGGNKPGGPTLIPNAGGKEDKIAGTKLLADAALVWLESQRLIGRNDLRRKDVYDLLKGSAKAGVGNGSPVKTEWTETMKVAVTVGPYEFVADFTTTKFLLEIEVVSLIYESGLVPDVGAITPMKDENDIPVENKASVKVSVGGFNTRAEADNARFETVYPTGVALPQTEAETTATNGAWYRAYTYTVVENTGFANQYEYPEGVALYVEYSGGVDDGPYGYTFRDEDRGEKPIVRIRDGRASDPNRIIPLGGINMARFQDYVNTANGSDKHYKMVEHVRLDNPASGGSNWTMVGESDICQFSGSFDGDGYTIANLAISKTLDYTGMFRYVDGGTIKNLGVSGSVTSSSSSYGQFTGGLVGRLENGTVENSFFYGNVTGRIFVGGLIGYGLTATVKDSYMAGNVLGAASGVTGTANTSVGGIAAYPAGAHLTLQRVFFSGYDKNTRGSVKGTSEVGGIIGGTNTGTVSTASYLTALNIDVSSIASGNKHNSIAGRVALNGTTITVANAFESTATRVILNADQAYPDGTSLGLKGDQNVNSNADPDKRIVRLANAHENQVWWETNMDITFAPARDSAGWHWDDDKKRPVLGRPLPGWWQQYLP